MFLSFQGRLTTPLLTRFFFSPPRKLPSPPSRRAAFALSPWVMVPARRLSSLRPSLSVDFFPRIQAFSAVCMTFYASFGPRTVFLTGERRSPLADNSTSHFAPAHRPATGVSNRLTNPRRWEWSRRVRLFCYCSLPPGRFLAPCYRAVPLPPW